MDLINRLNDDAKVALGLVVAEKMYGAVTIDEPGYKVGRSALDSCWEWLEGRNVTAEDLYNYIDSEDYMDVAEFASEEESEQKQYAWYTVLDAVSYTIYQAYKKEKIKYVPQAIEIVDDETLKILIENANESGLFNVDHIKEAQRFLLENHSFNTETSKGDPIRKELVMID
ncbi:immunity protein imm6 [Virgibacillus sp. 7505]|uniref:Imm6 family immunity protein n=1 Tax=Virgibacillus sp. 7505 TaxID=2022548 RepID=UPI000BA5D341|nr:Imm6 family immunity protein [Virgibacillus sp. 7505]PAE17906.1 immunity protein imm6 [Virgibacillus sp. 7505]